MRLGHDVSTVSFRRGNMNDGFEADWPNVGLGHMPNERFATRGLRLLRAVPTLLKHRRMLREADVVIARNFDLLALAWLAMGLSGARARLVYECLDIHGLFTRGDVVGRVMRFLERRLLGRIDLLWTSSPGFVRAYFEPVQGYGGRYRIIENKLWFDTAPPVRPSVDERAEGGGAFVLGWVGSIRCRASLDLLAGVAKAMGSEVRIAVHGNIHRHAVPEFDAVLAAHENITHGGAYRYPDDLSGIYLGCDAVWAQDLWQQGGNSDWLLPNRIYEAGWFGCPAIAVAGTETGRRVAADSSGFVIAEPTSEALVALLRETGRHAFRDVSAHLLSMPDRAFRLEPSDVAEALDPVLPGRSENDCSTPEDSVAGTSFR